MYMCVCVCVCPYTLYIYKRQIVIDNKLVQSNMCIMHYSSFDRFV